MAVATCMRRFVNKRVDSATAGPIAADPVGHSVEQQRQKLI